MKHTSNCFSEQNSSIPNVPSHGTLQSCITKVHLYFEYIHNHNLGNGSKGHTFIHLSVMGIGARAGIEQDHVHS